jgi:hypothetical protein
MKNVGIGVYVLRIFLIAVLVFVVISSLNNLVGQPGSLVPVMTATQGVLRSVGVFVLIVAVAQIIWQLFERCCLTQYAHALLGLVAGIALYEPGVGTAAVLGISGVGCLTVLWLEKRYPPVEKSGNPPDEKPLA